MIFNKEGELLATNKGLLPSVEIIQCNSETDSKEFYEEFSSRSDEFLWIQQNAQDWEPTTKDLLNYENPFSLSFPHILERWSALASENTWTGRFRKAYYQSLMILLHLLKPKNLGYLYCSALHAPKTSTSCITHVISSDAIELSADDMKRLKLSWVNQKKLSMPVFKDSDFLDLCQAPSLLYSWNLNILKPGLYLVLFDSVSTTKGIGNGFYIITG